MSRTRQIELSGSRGGRCLLWALTARRSGKYGPALRGISREMRAACRDAAELARQLVENTGGD